MADSPLAPVGRAVGLEIAHSHLVFADGPVANVKGEESSIPGGNVGF
jgi:hypothetical protein